METNMNYKSNIGINTQTQTQTQTQIQNSSINDKQRKLYLKINSLISSAENFETLKLYDESLKLFREATDLVKSLSKKQTSEESLSIKNFFIFFDSHIKAKMKILEQLVTIKNSIKKSKNNNLNSKGTIDISVLSKLNNSSNPQLGRGLQVTPLINKKEDVVKCVDNLISSCELHIRELDEYKKAQASKSILLDATMINQNSFYIPQIQKEEANKGALKGSNTSIEDAMLLEKIEEKFRIIYLKLNKLKGLYVNESVMQEKKNSKQTKLEKLKSSYSAMKKIYENAIRNGVVIK